MKNTTPKARCCHRKSYQNHMRVCTQQRGRYAVLTRLSVGTLHNCQQPVPELCPSERRRLVDGNVAEAQLFTRGYRFRAANLQLVRVAGSEARASKCNKGNADGKVLVSDNGVGHTSSAIRGQLPVNIKSFEGVALSQGAA